MLKRSLFVFVLVAAGCSAQTPIASSELNRRIENQVRSQFNLPPSVVISVGERKSSDFSGYDVLPVTLENAQRKSTVDFLISKDDKTLIHLNKLDISSDPYAVTAAKIDLRGRPVRGNKDAKVTIVSFDDFQCPYCAMMHDTLFNQIEKIYGNRVRIIYKDFPLSAIHPWAIHAAVNSNCLSEQNHAAYWSFADYVHGNQAEIQTNSGAKRPLADQLAKLDQIATDQAKTHGLDLVRLQSCLKKQDDSAVRSSMREGDDLGVDSTPTLFINGERIAGALPLAELRLVLDRVLRTNGVEAPASKAGGTAPAAELPAGSK